MQRAIFETHRRRALQQAHNIEHGIDPQTIRKAVTDILAVLRGTEGTAIPGRDKRSRKRDRLRSDFAELPHDELARLVLTLEEEMREASAELRFEYAAKLRDEINDLKGELRDVALAGPKSAAPPTRGSTGRTRVRS
jgi:excinuclease ABC subunit B